jgi:competence protein ComEC
LSNLKFILPATACVIIGFWLGQTHDPVDRITFLSVGQGDCAVIQSGDRAVLVDDGPSDPYWDAGERIVVPRLRELGVDRLDLILLSHPDSDHVGGTQAILKAHPEAKVAISSEFKTNSEMESHLAHWRLPKENILWLRSSTTGKIGNLDLQIYCPELPPGGESNDGSMFVKVGHGTESAVLTGDAPMQVESSVSEQGDWRASILKAGHHGSRTATGSTWLNAVGPKWVIISCGKNNRYGHPNAETVERIQHFGSSILRTDRLGDISFEWDRNRLTRR